MRSVPSMVGLLFPRLSPEATARPQDVRLFSIDTPTANEARSRSLAKPMFLARFAMAAAPVGEPGFALVANAASHARVTSLWERDNRCVQTPPTVSDCHRALSI